MVKFVISGILLVAFPEISFFDYLFMQLWTVKYARLYDSSSWLGSNMNIRFKVVLKQPPKIIPVRKLSLLISLPSSPKHPR